MISLAVKALIEQLKTVFGTRVGDRIYNNWPSQEVEERYPYIVIFTNRTNIQYIQEQLVQKRDKDDPNGFDIYSTGFFETLLDINYLAGDGDEDDQSDLIDKISDFFNITGNIASPGTPVSRDIPFSFHGYPANANVQFEGVLLEQNPEEIKIGVRRSIFNFNMYIPRLKLIKQPHWKSYELDAHISEKPRGNNN